MLSIKPLQIYRIINSYEFVFLSFAFKNRRYHTLIPVLFCYSYLDPVARAASCSWHPWSRCRRAAGTGTSRPRPSGRTPSPTRWCWETPPRRRFWRSSPGPRPPTFPCVFRPCLETQLHLTAETNPRLTNFLRGRAVKIYWEETFFYGIIMYRKPMVDVGGNLPFKSDLYRVVPKSSVPL